MGITSKDIRFFSRMGANGTLGQAIYDMAKAGKDFFAVSADLGRTSGFERLMTQYPEKYVDVGIAEQNLIGVSAGLSQSGLPVFATSYAPFITMRCADQVRNYLGVMHANVKLVGLQSGMIQAKFSESHYGIEDMSLIRTLPNLLLISPADALELYCAVLAISDYKGPAYLRLTGFENLPMIHKSEDYRFEIGKAISLREGKDVAVIGCGTILNNAIKSAGILEKKGISCTILDMHTIRPLDTNAVARLLSHKLIVTVEEHTVFGGLGSAVAEYLAPIPRKPPQLMLGVKGFFPLAGDYQYLLEQCGLTAEQIAQEIETKLLTL